MTRSRPIGPRLLVAALLTTLVGSLLWGPPPAYAGGSGGIASIDLSKSVSSTTITPSLALSLAVDRQTAIPGDTLTYHATVTNTGSTLAIWGAFVAQNSSATAATVVAWYDYVEYFSLSANAWVPLAGTAAAQPGYTPLETAPITTGLILTASGQPAAGVSYPTSGDQILGAAIGAGSTATWTYAASIALTPAEVSLLTDLTKVSKIRNVVHYEITPRPVKNGQPFTYRNDFSDAFHTQSGVVSGVVVTITLPSGSPAVIDSTIVPGLAALAPGASATVQAPYSVPTLDPKGADETDAAYLARLHAADGEALTATASASGTSAGGTSVSASAPAVSTTEQLPILSIAKSGPASVDAGSSITYDLALANAGTAGAASLAITDALPGGASGSVSDVPASLAPAASAAAHAAYDVPAAQPAGDLTDTASLTWTDANTNAYGPISASFTTQVTNSAAGAKLVLAPESAGPLVVGSTHTLTATATDTAGHAIANLAVHFAVTGANTAAGDATTDVSGTATFSYQGAAAGTDTAQATATIGGTTLTSNTASAAWITPAQPITTTTIHGDFYPNPSGSGVFTATPSTTPAFGLDFPTIDFNPPSGTVPGATSSVNTRPFTDIATDLAGNFAGSIVAEGNGYQAGVGSLYTFNAVFTGSYTVAAAGDITFDFFSDDGFIFGVGAGATRVGGAFSNPPASGLTPFRGYPVVGAYNGPTSPVANKVTVHFPGPGTYPYEVDYSECCGGELALTMANDATGHGVPPTGSLTMSPTTVTALPVGQSQSFTVAAMDASGAVVPAIAVTLTVTGPNAQSLTATTDQQGLARFTYAGSAIGTDELQASATISEMPALSNVVDVPWLVAPPAPTIGSLAPADGTVVTAPIPVTASLSPPAGQTIASWLVRDRCAGATTDTTIASGTGDPPATLATFDPTVLPNGTCTLTVSATASGGGIQTATISLIVDGRLKLGRYVTTYQDLSVGVAGLPLRILRTYDSFDKSVGDFGVGWRVEIANFRVSSNGPLGAGGWSQYNESCSIICITGFTTSRPHFVTVVWPDGHQEIFDFTPDGGSGLFWFGTPRFTGRPGTMSTLELVGISNVAYGGDGNLYPGITAGGSPLDPTAYKLTAKDGTVYLLSRSLGLTEAIDRNGNTLTIDASGVHSSLGPSISFSRDGLGRISRITDPVGNFLTYSYVGADLGSVRDQNGHTVSYSYDVNDNLQLAKDPAGNPIQTLTYGPDGRLQSITDGAGNTTTVSVDPNARTELVTSPGGLLTTLSTFDTLGDPIQIDQVTGGRTLTTRFTYDALGHVLSKTDPLGHTTQASWDAAGDPASFTEPSGAIWRFGYDAYRDLTSLTDPTGTPLATLTYDSAGNLATKMLADGSKTSYTYDSGGFLQSVTDALGRVTAYGHTPGGLVSAVTEPDGRVWSYGYDADGHLASATDPTGAATTFGYDGAGNLISVTDALGHMRSYTYDYADNVTSMTDPDGHSSTYVYDPAGQLASMTDRNGGTTTYAYDVFGHITSVTLPDGSISSYTFDPLGNLREADNADATLGFTYDDAGALTSQTSGGTASSPQPTVTLTFGRDAAGRLGSITAPWGTTTLGYDSRGLLGTLTDPQGGVFSLSYDPIGRFAGLTRPNGVDDVLAYDPAGQLTSRTSSLAGSAIDAISYTYDAAGRRVSMTDAAGTHVYGYDGADRLTSAQHPAGFPIPNETFSYDLVGNRTSGGATFDAANRLLSDATYTYTYDGEGDLTSHAERATGKTTTYAWTALHELTSATLPDGSVVRYRYDALGRRIEVATSAGTTRYVNLGGNVVAEYDASNALRTSYVVAPGHGALPGQFLESRTGTIAGYPLLDALGTVTALTDAAGSLGSFGYSAFGVPAGASAGTYSYGTYGYDQSTGLYQARARYYDPMNGRFLSEDPAPAANPYPYAASSPAMLSDPSGQQPLIEYSAEQPQSVEEAFLLVRDTGQFYADQGAAALRHFLTGPESDFLNANPWALQRSLGGVIHRLVANALEEAGIEVQYLTKGPDFLFKIGGEDVYVELTTPGQIAAHEARAAFDPRYAVAEIVTYILLL